MIGDYQERNNYILLICYVMQVYILLPRCRKMQGNISHCLVSTPSIEPDLLIKVVLFPTSQRHDEQQCITASAIVLKVTGHFYPDEQLAGTVCNKHSSTTPASQATSSKTITKL
jgi:hypothetical protein